MEALLLELDVIQLFRSVSRYCAGTAQVRPGEGVERKLLRGGHSADRGRSGSAALALAIAEELLDSFRSIDFPGVNVPSAIHTYLMQVMKFSSRPATAAEPP